jgi:hypothetical protein
MNLILYNISHHQPQRNNLLAQYKQINKKEKKHYKPWPETPFFSDVHAGVDSANVAHDSDFS